MLTFHFLNVGKGSSTIIEFPIGRVGMVDIDDSRTIAEEQLAAVAEMMGIESSYTVYKSLGLDARQLVEKAYDIRLTDPIQYLTKLGVESVFRFILTHPDMDHMSGLDRFSRKFDLLNFWDTDNNKEIDADSWDKSPYRKEDWDCYQQLREREQSPKVLRIHRDQTADCCWVEDGIQILSPSRELVADANDTEDYHHLSYVLKVTYANRSVILGGDASKKVWGDILEYYGEDGVKADVLLAPHHGSIHNFHKEAMEAMAPDYIIVSVAVGTDYAYDEYNRIGKVLSTKWYGNIVMTISTLGHIGCAKQFDR